MLLEEGRLLGPFGIMGGAMQPQAHLQFVSRLVDGADPQAALDAGRFRVEAGRMWTGSRARAGRRLLTSGSRLQCFLMASDRGSRAGAGGDGAEGALSPRPALGRGARRPARGRARRPARQRRAARTQRSPGDVARAGAGADGEANGGHRGRLVPLVDGEPRPARGLRRDRGARRPQLDERDPLPGALARLHASRLARRAEDTPPD